MMRRIGKRELFWGTLGLYFLFFLGLNILTPLVSDDYRYFYSFATGERITTLWQIFPSLYEHYFVMHGRTAVHFFTQLMLLIGKPVFNVVNAGMAVLLLLGLHRMAIGRGQKNLTVLVGLGALIFLCMPAFGQTMLWLDGACNYLWGITITVWVLIPFRDAVLAQRDPSQSVLSGTQKTSKWILPLFLFGSLFMGAASENSSPAAIVLMLLCLALLWKQTGSLRPLWRLWTATGLAAVGFLILYLSPANAIRSANYATEGLSTLGQYLVNFQTAAEMLLTYGLPLCCVFLVLFTVGVIQKIGKERLILAAFFFVAAMAANFAMTLSNGYPLRAMTGCAVFLMAGIGVLLAPLLEKEWRPLLIGAAVCAAFIAVITALYILPSNYNRYAEAKAREAYVVEQREAGNLNVTTYTLEGITQYDAFYDITDITYDETYWPNLYYAKYYGLETVVTDEIR